MIIDVLDKKDKYGHWTYVAECKLCGYKKYSHYGGIKKDRAGICTHLNVNGKYAKYGTLWNNKRIQSIFSSMKERCYSDSCDDYVRYGGRGISICDEWLDDPLSFETWALNNGYQDNLTIDRINVDGNYCPENCRWITLAENSKYKSTTLLINVDGEIHTGRDWSKKLGFSNHIITDYIRRYGMANTVEFIKRFQSNPELERKSGQSYYELYMNNTNIA